MIHFGDFMKKLEPYVGDISDIETGEPELKEPVLTDMDSIEDDGLKPVGLDLNAVNPDTIPAGATLK